MTAYYQQYEDPETGQVYDVAVQEVPRNAAPLPRSQTQGGPPPYIGGMRPRPRPTHPQHTSGGLVPRSHTMPIPVPAQAGTVAMSGDYLTIRKSALTEVIPVIGQVWASFLGRPDAPAAVGNDIIDRDNAALHRDALAAHQQNQTRILALTDLAARALNLLLQ